MRMPRAWREAVMNRVLRDVLYAPPGPEVPTRWVHSRGFVRYHTGGDYFVWSIDGVVGESDMTEDVMSALNVSNIDYS